MGLFIFGVMIIGLTLSLVAVWRQKGTAEERVLNLMGDLEMKRVEIERLKVDLEKSKARENDLSKKLLGTAEERVLEMKRVEVERLKVDLEKSKARENDLSKKLLLLVKQQKQAAAGSGKADA
ncbi:MAG: hypothetical protein LBO00_04465 [Zoogloeaceae bacterium]|nr:hypothetical protein [Zoogloeaceae bacterium]